jgi:hypothetical protein
MRCSRSRFPASSSASAGDSLPRSPSCGVEPLLDASGIEVAITVQLRNTTLPGQGRRVFIEHYRNWHVHNPLSSGNFAPARLLRADQYLAATSEPNAQPYFLLLSSAASRRKRKRKDSVFAVVAQRYDSARASRAGILVKDMIPPGSGGIFAKRYAPGRIRSKNQPANGGLHSARWFHKIKSRSKACECQEPREMRNEISIPMLF